jgi:isopenicillin N synthase-like dioxygenase
LSVVPLIDIGPFEAHPERRSAIATAVEQAAVRSGFMYVIGHGVAQALLDSSFLAMRQFFALEPESKQTFAYRDIDANFGYQGVATERLNPAADADLKESFTMRDALRYADDRARWPAGDFRAAALALYGAALHAAYRLLAAFAMSLELPSDFFALRHRGENVTLRFLHYPCSLQPMSAAQLGAGAHTDYGSITLLFQDEVGGLELQDAQGGWISAPPVPRAAIVNTGDLMERWTNGRLRSTVHRVRPMSGTRDRYSMALFVDPDSAVEVETFASCVSEAVPSRYTKITAGEHIRNKIAATQESKG